MVDALLGKRELVLFSSSPRRKELMEGAGFKLRVEKYPFNESYPRDCSIDKVALYLAEQKAAQLPLEKSADRIIITADTIVAMGDRILGKPAHRDEAIEMLSTLSGNSHRVLTGVCIKSGSRCRSFVSESKVKFADLSIGEIEYYVDNYKPFDKAGSYGIQEWIGYIGVEYISGSYFNVMGLPVQKLYSELKEFLKELNS